MERVAWTDERLDDLSRRTESGFARLDGEVRALRAEMHAGFAEVRREIDGLRSLMLRMNGAIIATVVATALIHGF